LFLAFVGKKLEQIVARLPVTPFHRGLNRIPRRVFRAVKAMRKQGKFHIPVIRAFSLID
tara:strand:+ start:819 stop:995 length:177 start_codon:yes stop_codon:yes gene_type:complete